MACEPLAGTRLHAGVLQHCARLMLSVAWPAAFAWKVSVNTDPSPEIPLLPGGREAVSCTIPVMLSSR